MRIAHTGHKEEANNRRVIVTLKYFYIVRNKKKNKVLETVLGEQQLYRISSALVSIPRNGHWINVVYCKNVRKLNDSTF